ncbi:MAG: methyl-accepting chemotaxis protein [Thermodesulfobacteriota bacterium]
MDKTRQVDEKFRSIIGRIHGASGRASEKVDTTDQILDRVYRISQQSHILSVNGSVEAARAGGVGLGFAVVAQEMAGLARDTKKTAQEIQDRLGAVHEAIQEVTDAVARSLDIADAHQTDIEDMNRMIATLKDSVKGLSDLFGD